MTSIDSRGAVTMPPIIGAAMRCITSEPAPLPMKSGNRPARITPNSAAAPASAMKPISVAIETACPSSQISYTPPTSASGRLDMMISASAASRNTR
jgi:hypothetical protein